MNDKTVVNMPPVYGSTDFGFGVPLQQQNKLWQTPEGEMQVKMSMYRNLMNFIRLAPCLCCFWIPANTKIKKAVKYDPKKLRINIK